MASQSACSSLGYLKIKSFNRRFFLERFCSTSGVLPPRNLTFQLISAEKAFAKDLRYIKDKPLRLNRGIVRASAEGFDSENPTGGKDGSELFPGKPDSVSSSEHAMEEEGKLESAPLRSETRSFPWIVYGLFVGCKLDLMTMRKLPAGLLASFFIEAAIYAGFATFLIIMDRVLSPYLKLGAKRLSLATGLRGYMALASFMKILSFLSPCILYMASAWH